MATQRVWYTAIMHLIFLFWFDCLSVECLKPNTDWCFTFNLLVHPNARECYTVLLQKLDGVRFGENYAMNKINFIIQDDASYLQNYEWAQALTGPGGICHGATMGQGPCEAVEGVE
ncbi:unnamed protein product [Albugo candida]|uniref:Uncharacterized protein n=1 Tax=Albugo candida TaxID=65357 RepID=A0A024FYJ1_9STRA|nr:unnamed protein product [Albugo candida]|eukprot:CCI11739.1 unnamed protein product [Albugo candida]